MLRKVCVHTAAYLHPMTVVYNHPVKSEHANARSDFILPCVSHLPSVSQCGAQHLGMRSYNRVEAMNAA
jgi:hypothetical protein